MISVSVVSVGASALSGLNWRSVFWVQKPDWYLVSFLTNSLVFTSVPLQSWMCKHLRGCLDPAWTLWRGILHITRSNWWQCLALAWTWWIQGIRHRVHQCLLSSRHRKASYQQHNSQGQRTLRNSYCCCFLGHFRNHKQVSAQMDCSLPASTLLLILHY